MSKTIRGTIDSSPLFKHLSEDWRERLAETAAERNHEFGDVIIEEGHEVHDLHIVLQGKVRVWTTAPQGDVELKTLERGAYFGEVSLLSEKEATATVESKSDPLRLLSLDRETVLEVVESDDKVRKMLEDVTLARAKDTIGKVLE